MCLDAVSVPILPEGRATVGKALPLGVLGKGVGGEQVLWALRLTRAPTATISKHLKKDLGPATRAHRRPVDRAAVLWGAQLGDHPWAACLGSVQC